MNIDLLEVYKYSGVDYPGRLTSAFYTVIKEYNKYELNYLDVFLVCWSEFILSGNFAQQNL